MPLYQCECRVGHYGSACETFNCDISPNACNGGVCVIETTGDMTCKLCPEFFYGNDCGNNPCGIDSAGVACSGHGTCVEEENLLSAGVSLEEWGTCAHCVIVSLPEMSV